ncbi:Nudix family hydrolase [Methylomonas paludis]|uniref:8-oxo-dGTP diphosphatase n=1 Tax=Methylomonas paludis TaxID=1173101 RepID=A0A975MQ20_9GAMM|nr:Nudix family hydrolase [Methylomonas paludis]QWF71715.1 Nudix family hydrolase [Methylomonas paludis]
MNARVELHVAVGVIDDRQGNILITLRPNHTHLGGLWEFPGGKLEAGETVPQALRRELQEEIGIDVQAATPLIKVRHDYGDRRVLLDVWRVNAYNGVETPREGQAMRWVNVRQLNQYQFPAANQPIIKAAQLPVYYAILEGRHIDEVLANCRRILQQGIRLLQFRVKSLAVELLPAALRAVQDYCRQYQAVLLINADLPLADAVADGWHLSSRALQNCSARPSGATWLAASCHNLAELRQAEQLGVDFVVLAPVQATTSHPGQAALGWAEFSQLTDQVNLPVYALGGLGLADLDQASQSGAQGIAGISAFLAAS